MNLYEIVQGEMVLLAHQCEIIKEDNWKEKCWLYIRNKVNGREFRTDTIKRTARGVVAITLKDTKAVIAHREVYAISFSDVEDDLTLDQIKTFIHNMM